MTYTEFLKSKIAVAPESGFDVDKNDLNTNMFEWQKDIIRWMLKKGRAEGWEDCGLGKTLQQLEFAWQVCTHESTNAIIFAPLSVSIQTVCEGRKFGIDVNIIENQSDIKPGINITNYEKLDKFDYSGFGCVVLDESSILKSYNGATRDALIRKFANTPYRSGWTATPAPNDYMEIGNHSEFLGVMSRNEMLSTFFIHDGSDTSKWRLKGHAEDKFWEWIASWAVVMTSPGDLGYPDDDYKLPTLHIYEHTVQSNCDTVDADGQVMFYSKMTQTLQERRALRRESIVERVKKAAEIANTGEQVLVWCDLNDESAALSAAIPGAIEVKGADSERHKIEAMQGFTNGNVRILVSKPSIAGWGMNWQNCHNVIFVGLSDSYEAWYQAIRRCWRFGQKMPVNVHMITAEGEGAVRENILRKQRESQRMQNEMILHTKDILAKNIRSTESTTEKYQAAEKIKLPSWIGDERNAG